MFVITADQIASRTRADVAAPTIERLQRDHGAALMLPPDRTAGDEIQLVSADAAAMVRIVLELTRGEQWSVGLGVGAVGLPLPAATREASGPAFYAARDAVTRAKKRGTRFALHRQGAADASSTPAESTEALIDLALALRQRRTAPGWELYDLVSAGLSYKEAAERLGISAPAASSRAKAAQLAVEANAVPALVGLLAELDRSTPS
ncbi:DNA-binding protein [Microterricola pindariensis]|uniref:DNA-binding protein n=1 Tax=Microterricola pindariensis TaxID=478010 RepID=A0ABX5ASB3_9MICO|nr:DNA-binding protein [Microterricola pindariensis]PPL14182.1 DNA-binding protein [Microterricola pindariensis]